MTQTNLTMTSLYDRLAAIGFPKKFVQANALPDWWCKEFEQTNGAEIEAAMYISRRLNLDMQSLLTNDRQPAFALTSQPKFKTRKGTNTQKLLIPYVLAARVAELVAYACKTPYQPLAAMTIAEIRQEILQTQPCVNLPGFLDFCWHHGIPVIHVAEFPSEVNKFDGMVARFDDRPIIILSLKDASLARLLFIAAHEFGHLYSGHLEENGFLLDEGIELESIDQEEFEANETAGELLLGRADMSYCTPHYFSGDRLASYAQKISKRDQVDAGVVAWNYGWYKKLGGSTEHWGAVRNALKILEPNANGSAVINQFLLTHLDWDRLSEDNQDYLEQMLGIEVSGV